GAVAGEGGVGHGKALSAKGKRAFYRGHPEAAASCASAISTRLQVISRRQAEYGVFSPYGRSPAPTTGFLPHAQPHAHAQHRSHRTLLAGGRHRTGPCRSGLRPVRTDG